MRIYKNEKSVLKNSNLKKKKDTSLISYNENLTKQRGKPNQNQNLFLFSSS